ncbi:MAG: BON domain-containing protein [Longimicrobiales bacterium]
MFEEQKPIPRMALKIGIAGFIGFGAVATGMFVTRKGRRLVREAWEGRERTRIEDRVLDALWSEPRLARRRIDVDETVAGHVQLLGVVRSEAEREEAVDIAARVKGVSMVLDGLQVVPREKKRRRASTMSPP